MFCAIICRLDDIIRRFTRIKLSLLHFNKLNIDNNNLSTNSEYDDQSGINFPFQFSLNQVDSTTDPLDEVVLTEVGRQPKNQGV